MTIRPDIGEPAGRLEEATLDINGNSDGRTQAVIHCRRCKRRVGLVWEGGNCELVEILPTYRASTAEDPREGMALLFHACADKTGRKPRMKVI
jgi:hypothetical protein